MADVVGLIASIAQLLEYLSNVPEYLQRGRDVAEKLEMVKKRVRSFEDVFEDEERRSRFTKELQDSATSELEEVKEILKSAAKAPPTPVPMSSARRLIARLTQVVHGVLWGGSVSEKLDKVLSIVNGLLQKVELSTGEQVGDLLRNVGHVPTNILPDVTPISTGLDRAHDVLQFLSSTSSTSGRTTGLRIVGIIGQGGLGKTTLLFNTLRELQSKQAFAFIAYVEEPDNKALKELQTALLQQLGGPKIEFQSLDHGKGALREKFKELADKGKSVCIAIDNVWRDKDLEALLPDGMASLLPSVLSCVLLTSRKESIVDALERICGGKPEVLRFGPQTMTPEASRELFLAHANSQKSHPFMLEHELKAGGRDLPSMRRSPTSLEGGGLSIWKEA